VPCPHLVTARLGRCGPRVSRLSPVKRRVVVHLSLWLAGAAVLRIAVIPAEVCPPVTATQVETAIAEAADWMVRGIGPDGRYVYGYDLETDREAPGYNSARHAGVTMSLYQVYEATGDQRYLESADIGLAYMLDRLEAGAGWLAWGEPGQSRAAGANGLLLAGMALRRRATDDSVHDGTMRAVGAFLVGQQEPGGAVLSRLDLRTGEPVPGEYGPFATGEAAWGLVLLGRVLPGEGWIEAALPVIDYIATDRDITEGYIARLPDHWAAYVLGDLPPEYLDETRLGLASRLAGYFGMRLRFEASRTGDGVNLWVRWYPGPLPGWAPRGRGSEPCTRSRSPSRRWQGSGRMWRSAWCAPRGSWSSVRSAPLKRPNCPVPTWPGVPGSTGDTPRWTANSMCCRLCWRRCR